MGCITPKWSITDENGQFIPHTFECSKPVQTSKPAGCTGTNEVHSKLDCDGDGYMDHACINTRTNEGWLVLSSDKCPLTWGSPQTKEDKCPQALANGPWFKHEGKCCKYKHQEIKKHGRINPDDCKQKCLGDKKCRAYETINEKYENK